ncbi:hypothetical protein WJX75_001936 [Coccomyxa subellipsoidea]|uniref:Uncharacterized protein n=1 Tax=Coccomyxa subellipsoidea TaxID=248742 RepID=A0ABR2YZR9_9CHLO
MDSDRVSVSQLCADFSGDEQDVRGRQPCIIFQIGNSRFQIGSLTDPGRAAAWPGSHSTTGFSYEASRELFAAVYDKAAIAGQTLIGMGAQKLDASTGTEGCIELQRANRQCIGALSFHLDTHGYDFDHPVYSPWGANIENPHNRVVDIGQRGG